jgi:hypothetical protein
MSGCGTTAAGNEEMDFEHVSDPFDGTSLVQICHFSVLPGIFLVET